MLMGCFFLFLGAAMDFGGAGIGKYFDDQVWDGMVLVCWGMMWCGTVW